MRRGLFASGITRSRSIYSRPFTVGAADVNVFRQLEFALEVALGDPLIQVGPLFLLGGVGAFDDQQIVWQ